MALAVVLLSGAGLLLHSFYHLILTNPGVRIENLLAADLSKASAPSAQTAFYDELLSLVRGVPDVQRAAAVSALPLGSDAAAPMPSIAVPGSGMAKPPEAMTRVVTPSYFATMDIPIVEGWGELLCMLAGLPPTGEGVSLLSARATTPRKTPRG